MERYTVTIYARSKLATRISAHMASDVVIYKVATGKTLRCDHMAGLGKPACSRTDQFLEKFQEGFD